MYALLGAAAHEEAAAWVMWTVGTVYFLPGSLVGLVFGALLIEPINALLGWLFRSYNRVFDRVTGLYGFAVGRVLRLSIVVLVVYGGLLVMTWWQFTRAPSGFTPSKTRAI
ncbi:MAG: efflux RND transporter permease subunit [Gemmataceae bacterium]